MSLPQIPSVPAKTDSAPAPPRGKWSCFKPVERSANNSILPEITPSSVRSVTDASTSASDSGYGSVTDLRLTSPHFEMLKAERLIHPGNLSGLQPEWDVFDKKLFPVDLLRQWYKDSGDMYAEGGLASLTEPSFISPMTRPRAGTSRLSETVQRLNSIEDTVSDGIELPTDVTLLMNTDSQTDFHSLNVSGTSPSDHVGHGCVQFGQNSQVLTGFSTDFHTLHVGGALAEITPTFSDLKTSEMVDTECCMPVGGNDGTFSEVGDDRLSARSIPSDLDVSDDVYWNALHHFLDWVDRYWASTLIAQFSKASGLPEPRSSLRSHTTGSSSYGPWAAFDSSATNPSQNSKNSKGKRGFHSPDGPVGNEVQNSERATKTLVTSKKKIKLACHYFKKDSSKFSRGRYKTCPNGFDGLNRLKDHQVYVHAPAHFCQRCKRIFKTHGQREIHGDQDVRCERREDPAFADLLTSDDQRAALKKKKPTSMKDEEFWFELWDKYFPGIPRPASAFQEVDPTLVALRDFAERELLSTIMAYRAHQAHDTEHALTAGELATFWQFGINHVVTEFANQQRSRLSRTCSPPEQEQPLPAVSPLQQEQPPPPPPPPPQQQQQSADFSDQTPFDLEHPSGSSFDFNRVESDYIPWYPPVGWMEEEDDGDDARIS